MNHIIILPKIISYNKKIACCDNLKALLVVNNFYDHFVGHYGGQMQQMNKVW